MRQEMMSIGFALSALDSIVTCADIDCYKETQEPSISVQSRLPCRLFQVVCIDRWSSIETMDKEAFVLAQFGEQITGSATQVDDESSRDLGLGEDVFGILDRIGGE